uniref:Uncharacterized protein n=1 Tax=Magallana gigas TaxID=29159 RepID=A0A8W8IAT9_MAGGI
MHRWRLWFLNFYKSEVYTKMSIVLPRHFVVLELGLDSNRDSTFCLTELSTGIIDGGKKSQLTEIFGQVLHQIQQRVFLHHSYI